MTPRDLNTSVRGMSRLGVLLFILLLVAGVFVGFQVLPFYYGYYEIEGLMQEQAKKASVFTDDEIRRNLLERIDKLELPIDSPEDLKINRFNDKITIDLEYQEVLYVDFGEDWDYDLWVFDFNPRAEAPVR